jgi:hypothetical protein
MAYNKEQLPNSQAQVSSTERNAARRRNEALLGVFAFLCQTVTKSKGLIQTVIKHNIQKLFIAP